MSMCTSIPVTTSTISPIATRRDRVHDPRRAPRAVRFSHATTRLSSVTAMPSWTVTTRQGALSTHSADGVQIIGHRDPGLRARTTGDGAINGMGDDWVIEDYDIHHNAHRWHMDRSSGDPVVRDNHIHHNGRSGLSVRYTDGGLVENNEISYNNYRAGVDWGTEAGGGKMWDNDRSGYSRQLVPSQPRTWIVDRPRQHRNRLREQPHRGQLRQRDLPRDQLRRHHQEQRYPSQRFEHDAWLWGGGIMIASSQNVEIYGNTLEDNYNGIAMTRQNRGTGEYGLWTLANNYVHDNTVIDSGLTGAAQDVGSNAIYSSNIRFENNTYTGDFGWCWLNRDRSWSAVERIRSRRLSVSPAAKRPAKQTSVELRLRRDSGWRTNPLLSASACA